MKFFHILYVLALTVFPLLQAADTAEILEPCFIADQVHTVAMSANDEMIAVAHKPQSPYKHPTGFKVYNLASGEEVFSYTGEPEPKKWESYRNHRTRPWSLRRPVPRRTTNRSYLGLVLDYLNYQIATTGESQDAQKRQPYIQSLALSPDGTFVAAIEHCSTREFPLLQIFRLEDGVKVRTFILKNASDSLQGPIELRFIDNENLIFLCNLKYRNNDSTKSWLYHLNTRTRQLTRNAGDHRYKLLSVHGNTIVLSYHHFSGRDDLLTPLECKTVKFSGTDQFSDNQQFNIVYLPKQLEEDISQCVWHPTDPNEFFVCHGEGVESGPYARELCSFELRKYTIDELTYEVLLKWTSSDDVLIFSHAFMPDGRLIITNNCPGDGAIKIVELETGNILGTLPQSEEHAPCFLTTHGKFAYGIDTEKYNPSVYMQGRKYTFYNLSHIHS